MNYLSQQLMINLTKSLYELPTALRTPETQLESIETLLANFLSQEFPNPHEILDDLRDHVRSTPWIQKVNLSSIGK